MNWCRTAGVITSAVVLTAVVSGCGGSSPTVSNPPSLGAAAPPPSATTSEQAAAPVPNGPTPKAAGPDRCHSAMLALSLGRGGGAAGSVYQSLRFTNVSGKTCTLQGFPGVSYVTGDNGTQVGEPAVRVGTKGDVVTVAPGATASVELGMVNVGNYDAAVCKPTPVKGLRVYPPNETASLFIPSPGTGCAGTPPGQQLKVTTMKAGQGDN
ncbi:DUF4232 domain-containing protein [Pseudonocardia spinosispora]|uniref:DUF4232 domain-containing protein n=1 Tax=Pseudonocardia spinosispora TaxID=103441 RepID=UPI00040E399C|nr:DUF4232 domain-containing protein [Pseudonocardia spinosispora]